MRAGRDDPSLGHEGLRKMELKYFLEDETVSVQQVGAEKLLLKRQLLPKKFSWADQDLRPLAPSSSETIEMLTLDDIEVGGAIDVLGRPMRVYDCDPPSRALAKELLDREFAPSIGAPDEARMATGGDAALPKQVRTATVCHVNVSALSSDAEGCCCCNAVAGAAQGAERRPAAVG